MITKWFWFGPVRYEAVSVNWPVPSPSRMTTRFSGNTIATTSRRPSPFKSPVVVNPTPRGPMISVGVGKLPGAVVQEQQQVLGTPPPGVVVTARSGAPSPLTSFICRSRC